jgi:DNA helicase-2/ATP-dependent DNA helicase PcrA
MDELPENFIDRSFAGGGAKNQGYGNGTAFERMKGWGGSGKDWTSDNRSSTKKETPSYLAPKTNIQKVIEHVPSNRSRAQVVAYIESISSNEDLAG